MSARAPGRAEALGKRPRAAAWAGLAALPAALVTAAGTYWFVLRPWHLVWGATASEVESVWPGDHLIPHPMGECTHAITINRPAAAVWPWLAQIGQGRGGFYSYAWLENLLGCRMENADRIMPEHQQLRVGDPILDAPERVAADRGHAGAGPGARARRHRGPGRVGGGVGHVGVLPARPG